MALASWVKSIAFVLMSASPTQRFPGDLGGRIKKSELSVDISQSWSNMSPLGTITEKLADLLG